MAEVIRTVNTKDIISSFVDDFDPNNEFISLRETTANYEWGKSSSSNKSAIIEITIDQKTRKVSIFDNGTGIANRSRLVKNIGTPSSAEYKTFNGKNRGLQSVFTSTGKEESFTIITKNSEEIFKQQIFIEKVLEWNFDKFASEDKVLVDKYINRGFNTFTHVEWVDTKKKLTENKSENKKIEEEIQEYLQRTFEWLIRIKNVKIFIRFDSNDSFTELTPYEYVKLDYQQRKPLQLTQKILGENLDLIIYQNREVSEQTHYHRDDTGGVFLSTLGILPFITPMFPLNRDDITVTGNYDGLADSIKCSNSKEKYNLNVGCFASVRNYIQRAVSENFPKTDKQLSAKKQKLVKELNKGLTELLKKYQLKSTRKEDGSPPKKLYCKECGKLITEYPCPFCSYDPNTVHIFKWKCNDCYAQEEKNIPEELRKSSNQMTRREKMKFANVEKNWTWVSVNRKEEKCPKCGSKDIELMKRSNAKKGIVDIYINSSSADAIRPMSDEKGLRLQLGQKHKLIEKVVEAVTSKAYNTIIGLEAQAVEFCQKNYNSIISPDETDVHLIDSMISGWNEQASKILIMYDAYNVHDIHNTSEDSDVEE